MKILTKSLLLTSSIVLFSGCQQDLSTPSEKPKIDLNLPTVQDESLRAIPSYRSIALEWASVPQSSIKGYYIYRSNMQKAGTKFKRIKQFDNRYTTHYLDRHLEANSKYAYSVSVIGKNGLESSPSKSKVFQTLPALESVSYIEAISDLPKQIKILWRPHPYAAVKKYIIERTTPIQSKWKEIAVINHRLNVEYIDDNLGDNELYIYRIKAVTFDGIVSNPSKISKAKTKPLPLNVQEFTASNNLPRKIELQWANSKTQDIVLYNIYRSNRIDGTFTKIAQSKVDNNLYDDAVNEDGKVYFYKITTFDKDGLESDIKESTAVMGTTLAKPQTPLVTLAQIQGNKVILNWLPADKRSISYNVYKTVKDGWSSSKTKLIPNINALRYEDPDIVRGVEYRYSVQAVDKFGLASEKTKESSMTLPPLQTIKK